MSPVRPSIKSVTDPPPRNQEGSEGAARGEGDEECEDASIASPTSVMDGDVGNMREVEAMEDENGFVVDSDLIDIEQKDEDMEIKIVEQNLEPVEIVAKDSRIPRALNAPIRPSAEDVDAHNIAHTPPRPWCDICVAAYGKEDPHFRGANDKDETDRSGVPIVSFDYNDLEKGKVMTIVGKDETSGMPINHKVSCKGPTDEWIVKRIVKDLEDLGRRDIILKTDGEPAMIALQSKIIECRAGRTIPRNPPVYNPESNGPCEKMVQDVNSKTRACSSWHWRHVSDTRYL